MLGKLLLKKPDILLLDEPTNHLDTDSVQWLEAFLRQYRGTIFVISHDRYFLDKLQIEPSSFLTSLFEYIMAKLFLLCFAKRNPS